MEKKKVTKKTQTKITKSSENKIEQSEFGFSSLSKSEISVESNTTETVLLFQRVAFEGGQEIPQQRVEELRIEDNSRQEAVADLSSRGNFRSIENNDTEFVVRDGKCHDDGSDIAISTAGEDFGETEHLSGVFLQRIPILEIDATQNDDLDIAKSTVSETEHFSGDFISRIPILETDATRNDGSDIAKSTVSETEYISDDFISRIPILKTTNRKDGSDIVKSTVSETEHFSGDFISRIPIHKTDATQNDDCDIVKSTVGETEHFSGDSISRIYILKTENKTNSEENGLDNKIGSEKASDCRQNPTTSFNDSTDEFVLNERSATITEENAEMKNSDNLETGGSSSNNITPLLCTTGLPEDRSNSDKLDSNSKQNSVSDLVKYFEGLKSTSCKKKDLKNMINSPNETKNLESESKLCTTSIVSLEKNTLSGSKKFPSTFEKEPEYEARSRKRLRIVTPEPEDELTDIEFSVTNNNKDFCEVNEYAGNHSDRYAVSEEKMMLRNDTEIKSNNISRSKIPVSRFTIKQSRYTPPRIAIQNGRNIAEETSEFPITARNNTKLILPKIFSHDTRPKKEDKVDALSTLKCYNAQRMKPTICNIIRRYNVPRGRNLITGKNKWVGILLLAGIVTLLSVTRDTIKHLLGQLYK